MALSAVEVIRNFFETESADGLEMRDHPRQRFVRPARIIAEREAHKAFTYNISRDGVGLMHKSAILTGPADIEIELRTGTVVRVIAEVLWCRHHGDHYLSGAWFLEGFHR
jgi:hypothetical protein